MIENSTSRVCGIVLAWCERNHIAYIMPMEVVLEDIKRTLGARDVCLPRFKAGQGLQAQSISSPTSKGFNAQPNYRRELDGVKIVTDEGLSINKGLGIEEVMNRLS